MACKENDEKGRKIGDRVKNRTSWQTNLWFPMPSGFVLDSNRSLDDKLLRDIMECKKNQCSTSPKLPAVDAEPTTSGNTEGVTEAVGYIDAQHLQIKNPAE